jgi:hypothetical protein
MKFFETKNFLKIKMAAMILLPLILLFLPKTQFDTGPTTCLITLISGYNCLGCGMTRACMRLIHLDIPGAMEFNKLSLIVFPVLCFFYAKEFWDTFKKHQSL